VRCRLWLGCGGHESTVAPNSDIEEWRSQLEAGRSSELIYDGVIA